MSARVGPFFHREVAEFVRRRRDNPRYVGPIYHMPFPGHRTVAQVWLEEEESTERRRARFQKGAAKKYGFDPDSLELQPERGR